MTHEIKLAIYDLSQGMARQLSSQFLGPDHSIEIVPHTGIVAYGWEYYFGGGGGDGITKQRPDEFRSMFGLYPVEIVTLGRTTTSGADFEAWCALQIRSGRFRGSSYDLLRNNCNNFSHAAATEGLKLGRGVPEWILNVPQRFLSSPFGQIVRPILENMQIAPPSGGGDAAFVQGHHHHQQSDNSSINNNNPPTASAAAASTGSSSMHDASYNPWATNNNIAGAASMKASSSSSSSSEGHSKDSEQSARQSNSKTSSTIDTPTLDLFRNPLLSKDSKTAALCVKKLSESAPSEEAKAALKKIEDALCDAGRRRTPTKEQIDKACEAIMYHLIDDASKITFALMLLRLVVLTVNDDDDNVIAAAPHLDLCLDWAQRQVQLNGESALKTSASRSMAWCVLSNALATTSSSSSQRTKTTILDNSLEQICEAALRELHPDQQPRMEIRQAAAAFLYNVTLSLQKRGGDGSSGSQPQHLSDLFVSMLCGCMDGIGSEQDATTLLRRLLVACRVVKRVDGTVDAMARNLMSELGFADALREVAKNDHDDDDGQRRQICLLARELISLVQP